MKPVDDNVFELVVLDGHKGKIVSNSNEPPNSFHTNDLFTPHPTLMNRWKYIGRHDDRITLSNGEKFIPLDLEGLLRQSHIVKEAVVFGVDKPLPGLLLFKSDAAATLSKEEYTNQLWPVITEGNRQLSAFAKIGREYIAVLPETVDCPSTDKQSIKRAFVYQMFSKVIEDVYRGSNIQTQYLKLDIPELEQWLVEEFEHKLNIVIKNREVDFFAAGVDSQKAIQAQRLIIQTLDLGQSTRRVSSLVVFEQGNIKRLAKFLHGLRFDSPVSVVDDIDVMDHLHQKYTNFTEFLPTQAPTPDHATVLLTGATGSLGSAILCELIGNPTARIYCPVRAKNVPNAISRTLAALECNGYNGKGLPSRVHIFPCDLSIFPLSIPQDILSTFALSLTHIIHAAWAVNFSLSLSSFEPQLQTLHFLYCLTLLVQRSTPAGFMFCSSIGTAMASPLGTTIEDEPIPSQACCAATGYARSKFVAERILESASAKNQNVTILRLGQIIPSMNHGASKLWNPSEMIPLVISCSKDIKAFPGTPGPRCVDSCTWIPVNVLAKVILDLSSIENPGETDMKNKQDFVYNIVSSKPCSWEKDFLPKVQSIFKDSPTPGSDTSDGHFPIVPFSVWLEKLYSVTSSPSTEYSFLYSHLNPVVDIWRRQLSQTKSVLVQQPEDPAQIESENHHTNAKELTFSTESVSADSAVFRSTDWDHLLLADGYLEEVIRAWKDVWH
ncbi:nrps-like protein [Phaeomoniella chlamydospora]|uniref:Nrps-like protein n=1 Tax=Phaeomoniella chlamydospora TaxID=158046 RepID=A0A0G2GSK5_PHACM|nr:nrps-like protein [Phaeomoniella chlamydospora]